MNIDTNTEGFRNQKETHFKGVNFIPEYFHFHFKLTSTPGDYARLRSRNVQRRINALNNNKKRQKCPVKH